MINLKKKKSVLTSLVICLVFLLFFSPAVFAQGEVQLSASSETGSEGDTISVAVSIDNAAGTEGGQFELNFDPDVVVPVDISKGGFVSNAANDQFNHNLEFDSNTLMVIWVTPNADTSDSGTVCTIDFELVGEGETSLSFAGVIIAPDDLDVAATHIAGSITVDVEPEPDPDPDPEPEPDPDPDPEPEPDPEPDPDPVPTPETGGSAGIIVTGLLLVGTGFLFVRKPKKSK